MYFLKGSTIQHNINTFCSKTYDAMINHYQFDTLNVKRQSQTTVL